MAALLPSSSLSSALRQQSSALPLHLNSSSAMLSAKAYSTSSFVSRLGQRVRHESQTRQSALSRTSTYSSQPRRSIAIQARPPPSTPITTAKPPSKLQPSAPPPGNSLPAQPSSSSETLPLTNLPYFIRRTPSNQLPVYIVTKSGGTRQQTKIQKTEGDLEALRTDLARALGLESSGSSKSPDVFINRLNGHIIVKGWRKPEIVKFLSDRKF